MSTFNKWMIDPTDAVMCLVDHQSGLFQLVRDIDQPTLRHHVCALAKVARLAKVPTFTTASVPDGPNGPLIPEIHQYNPEAVYIPRTGQINAWDNPKWVEAIEKTGRKTLLIAGTLTSVCMARTNLRLPHFGAPNEKHRTCRACLARGAGDVGTATDSPWSRRRRHQTRAVQS